MKQPFNSGDAVSMSTHTGTHIDTLSPFRVKHRPASYSITVADLREALQKQGTTVSPGDVVLVRTGLTSLWPEFRLFDQAGLSLVV